MPDPVQDAANVIDSRMETGFLNPVTNGEIKDVVQEITALPAGQADELVDRLAADGTLDRVAGEVMDGSILGLGGLSTDERQAFFADMAGKLDGDSLGRLSDAFAGTDGDSGGFEPVTELGSAVATHASPQTRVDYIASIQSGIETGNRADFGIGYSSSSGTDAEAVAAGEVLGSLRGTYAEDGFRTLGDDLPAVLSSSIDERLMTVASSAGSSTSVSWNADNYEAIMGAAASMSDADLKAQVFDSGVEILRQVRDTDTVIGGLTVMGKDETMARIADGLTNIINSDTTGVMRELTFNAQTRDGSDFAAYAKEMLQQGREAELGEQMGRLQVGNNGTENAVDRLYQSEDVPFTEQTRLPNAASLGYFVGSVHAAVTSIDADVAQERQMTTALLKSTLAVVDKASGLGGPVTGLTVGTSAAVAKEWVQVAVDGAITNENADAGVRLESAALPVDSRTGETGVGSDVVSAFEDTLATVNRLARP